MLLVRQLVYVFLTFYTTFCQYGTVKCHIASFVRAGLFLLIYRLCKMHLFVGFCFEYLFHYTACHIQMENAHIIHIKESRLCGSMV